jgi:hypothetical protein
MSAIGIDLAMMQCMELATGPTADILCMHEPSLTILPLDLTTAAKSESTS